MGPKLELRNEQKLIMTPMLQQALKVLQLPALELADLVRQELSENPLLEETEDPGPGETPSEGELTPGSEQERTAEVGADETGTRSSEFDEEAWAQYFSDDGAEPPVRRGEHESTDDEFAPQIAKQPSLEEHLLWQLRLNCRGEEDYRVGEVIIGNLDERGFLLLPLAEIAEQAGCSPEQAEAALQLVQSLEPTGIAARSVSESLLLQLRALPARSPLAEVVVERHFEAFERQQWEAIARAEHASRDAVLVAARVIAALDPYPGLHQSGEQAQTVVPDAVVEKRDDEYVIRVNDDTVPELHLSRTYRQLLRRGSGVTVETRAYLNDKLQRAVWMIRSIAQRRKTLYRVVEALVELQRKFFDLGVEHLRPLTLKDIALRLSLHESTISRVTSRKYVQTPRGVFELKYFFSHEIRTTDGGEVSATSVKAALKELIGGEDPKQPWSDQKLTEQLAAQGFALARRTVAKYREELNLLPAHRRKRLAAGGLVSDLRREP